MVTNDEICSDDNIRVQLGAMPPPMYLPKGIHQQKGRHRQRSVHGRRLAETAKQTGSRQAAAKHQACSHVVRDILYRRVDID